jgi:hypothetical protein
MDHMRLPLKGFVNKNLLAQIMLQASPFRYSTPSPDQRPLGTRDKQKRGSNFEMHPMPGSRKAHQSQT